MYKLISLISLLLLVSCINENTIISQFRKSADKIQQKYVPDRSLNIFAAELKKENDNWILAGNTNIMECKEAVMFLADSLLGKKAYLDQFDVLPEKSLADSTYGIVSVSVSNIRRLPKHSAEMVDQNIMGQVVRIFKREKGWYLIQTEYGYIGWMHNKQVKRTNLAEIEKWQTAPKVIVTELFGRIFEQANEKSLAVSDFVINMLLEKSREEGKWTKVNFPDNKTGYIKTDFVKDYENKKDLQTSHILNTAKSMLGVPYLWGGNSSKGNDCSGFTQTVFSAHGKKLPRDARQQALIGEAVNNNNNDFSNVQEGDLLFFGHDNRVTHVGISLGGDEFIHQAGQVHISSLDENKENYSPYRKKSLMQIRRVINVQN